MQLEGFRQGLSTETAVLSDIHQAVERGDMADLVLLDLPAAFYTVEWWTVTSFCNAYR